MLIGMLWYDNTKGHLHERIEKAADYYERKYGQWPSVVYVNPVEVPGVPVTDSGIEIRTSTQILPHHFWVGMAEEPGG